MTSDDPTHTDDPGSAAVPDAERVEAARRAMRLVDLAREVERYVAGEGWDQNPRLFALARTADLVALEPELAEALGAEHDPESLTPIEQELVDRQTPLDELLATTMWPADVVGAAVVLERLVLPPSAEDGLPDDDAGALSGAAASHPEREDVRMAVVVTRDGGRMCALRLRSHDVDDEVLVGEDLVPRLTDALRATFA